MATKETSLAEQYPDVWIPTAKGDKISGKVHEVIRASSAYGPYPLIRIVKPDGEVKNFHALGVVATERLKMLRPVPGERIVISYEGKSQNPREGQSAANLYDVQMPDRDPAEMAKDVWDSFGGHDNDAVRTIN